MRQHRSTNAALTAGLDIELDAVLERPVVQVVALETTVGLRQQSLAELHGDEGGARGEQATG
jgi:hypothetical protein